MRKVSNFTLKIILALGLMCLVGGFLIFVYAVEADIKLINQIWPLLLLLAGVVITYVSMAFLKKTYLLFIGLEITLCACYALVLERKLVPLNFVTGWPLFVVLTGFVLIISCLYKHNKLYPRYFVPAVVMVALGAFFMLFSLDIIKMPLSKFLGAAGPLLMIIVGLASIVFFLIQSDHKELVIKDENTDIDIEE